MEGNVRTWESNEFKPLITFFLEFKQDLIANPIRGELDKIRNIFNQYCKTKKIKSLNGEPLSFSYGSFSQFIVQFNQINGEALKFNKQQICEKLGEFIFQDPQLKWINLPKLLLLNDRIDGVPAREIKFKESKTISVENFKSKSECLISILGQPLFTEIKLDFSNDLILDYGFNANFQILDSCLRKATAKVQLAKEKAQLKTSRKSFFEICDDANHNHILSNIGFNKKEYPQQGLIKQNFPDNEVIHQKIYQVRHLINQEIFKCSQSKTHFLPILNNHTDLYLGDCSYLDTCHKMKTCRYLHYYTLTPIAANGNDAQKDIWSNHEYTIGECFTEYLRERLPPQWINCDVRYLPFSVLGKFAVIISDPAWDIHMSLPYGTCKDFELLSLPMHELQDEGIILLWVTGRSIEIGRKALIKWGYQISDEMIWVKLNQLKRTIVTGRTGHWLNHSKEHLLVGIKGNPYWLNRKMDIDIVVSGTRETSRKPDEIYDIVERIVGTHSRKLEIFGRDHNIRPGWLTVGNQLQGTFIYEKEVKMKYDEYIKTKN